MYLAGVPGRSAKNKKPLTMTNESDQRTQQFKEVAIFVGILIIIHLILVLIGRSSMAMISLGYVFFAAGVIPIVGIIISLALRSRGQWHWGQVLLSSLSSLILGFFQIVIVASASASV